MHLAARCEMHGATALRSASRLNNLPLGEGRPILPGSSFRPVTTQLPPFPGERPSRMDASSDPFAVYRQRLGVFRSQEEQTDRQLAWIGNARFAVFGIGILLVILTLPLKMLSPFWLMAPVVVFMGLSIRFQQVTRRHRYARRAINYYASGLDRLEDRWAGRGISGADYLDENHLCAADLDLFGKGSMFERLCTARTRIGRDTLAHWLAVPASPEEIRARQEAVRDLRDRLLWREQLALLGAEVPEGINTAALIEWGKAGAHKPSAWPRWVAPWLVVITVVSAVAWLDGWVSSLALLLALLLQGGFALLVRMRVRRALAGLEGRSGELFQLAGILTRIERETFTSARLIELQARLKTQGLAPSKRLAQLVRMIEMLDSTHNNIFAVLAPLILWTTQVALAVETWRWQTGTALERWLAVIGEVEALSALACYAYENPTDPFPEIVAEGPLLEAKGLGHPLLPRRTCVTNDITLGRVLRLLVISGSNMSGKSTFLRTVGINAVLALAGAPVRADQLRISPLAIGATVRIQDSLQAGYSRFYAEITRLQHIVELTKGPLPVLFLLDEILHGTNSHDRRIGGEAVLRNLLQQRTLGLVTTHDLALTQIADQLAPAAGNVHFVDQLINGTLQFDYRLHPGVVQHSNALALMRAVGLSVEEN